MVRVVVLLLLPPLFLLLDPGLFGLPPPPGFELGLVGLPSTIPLELGVAPLLGVTMDVSEVDGYMVTIRVVGLPLGYMVVVVVRTEITGGQLDTVWTG